MNKVAWIPNHKDSEAGTLSAYGVEYVGGNFLKNLPDDLSTARAATIASTLNHETRGHQGLYIVVDC